MKAEDFDKKFDEGKEDILNHVGEFKKTKRVNIDFPQKVVEDLDQIAGRIGISRQSLVKMWIHEKINNEKKTV